MSGVDPARARGFDAWAGDYDRYRPTYPDELFEAIAQRLPIPRQPHVVDLGAGTGRASLAMAELGWRVTAVEPGKPMLDVLRGRAANQGLLVPRCRRRRRRPAWIMHRPTWSPRRRPSIGSTRTVRWGKRRAS